MEKDILHMDVSMQNVMVAPMPHKPSLPWAVLVDFGCARRVPGLKVHLSEDSIRGNAAVGNEAHLAPEVVNAWRRVKDGPQQLDLSKQVLRAAAP
jgi:hypothetical protein